MAKLLQRSLLLLVVALGVSSVGRAQRASPSGVQADLEVTYEFPNGQVLTTPSHYYRSADRKLIREDSQGGAHIIDLRNGTVTLLIADRKEAHVMNVPTANGKPLERRVLAGAPVPLEESTVEGHPVTKARASAQLGESAEVWTAKDLGLVVYSRISSGGLTVTRSLKNISLDEPAASLFEVPQDYAVTESTLPADFVPKRPIGRGKQ